jgi:hypothetical protein
MSDPLISKAEQHAYRQLFLHDLHWSAPDHTPIDYTTDGRTLTATNVSSYKGLRVWVCAEKPGSQLEAQLDREIAKTSTDRLVIFHDGVDQVWRWPVRRNKDAATTTRLTSHRHRTGTPDPKFEARLDAIRLPLDAALDPNAVLAKVRAAFDVEAQNETKHASKLMARMYAALEKSYPASYDKKTRDHEISATLARILFLMFGDDTDMWAADLFRDFIHVHTAADGSDLGSQLNALFVHLDTQSGEANAALGLEHFPYVNGGIFQERVTLPGVNPELRIAVLDACSVDWSTISPAIFGSMFQSVRDAKTRRELGEHYTSEENILKTLNPLFLDELRADFERAKTMKNELLALKRLWERLEKIRFMDPACGCGNFIIVAYRELRDLELRIMERFQDISGDVPLGFDPTLDLKVTLDHFCGIEIDEWPARIAETAMFLIDRQCDLRLKERFGEAPQRLPIQRQAKIVVANALLADWTEICPPSDRVIIAGNPPFLGKKQRTSEQTADMQAVWGSGYSGEADYVTAWFAKAAQYFGKVVGEWAFVATSSVAQGVTVAPVFGYLFDRGWRIKFAHRTFAWASEATGQATVHCVIVGFTNDAQVKPRLFDYVTSKSQPDEIKVSTINAYLVDGPNLLVRDRRTALCPQLDSDIRFGSMAADDGGLFVTDVEHRELVATDPIAVKHLRRFVGARELLHSLERWCIWMPELIAADIAASPFLSRRIEHVRKFRAERAKDPGVRAAASMPYRFNRIQQPKLPYLCIPRHVSEGRRYFPAARFNVDVIAGDANFVVDDPDGFFFALISSSMFITWQRTVGGRLESRLRFASTFTWNTLPLPYTEAGLRSEIIEAGRGVLAVRQLHPEKSLAQLYQHDAMDDELIAAHDHLDKLVDRAFGAGKKCETERERQQILFNSYQELTSPLVAAMTNGRKRR